MLLDLTNVRAAALNADFWDDLRDLHTNGIYLDAAPDAEQVPVPWDATFEIIGRDVRITGGTGPSGGQGSVVITIPVAKFHQLYTLELDDTVRGDHTLDEVQALVESVGFSVRR